MLKFAVLQYSEGPVSEVTECRTRVQCHSPRHAVVQTRKAVASYQYATVRAWNTQRQVRGSPLFRC